MRLPKAIFRTIIVLVAIFAMISSGFVMTSTGDVLSPMGTGTGAASSRYGWNITYAGNVNNDTFDDVRREVAKVGKNLVMFGVSGAGVSTLLNLERICPFGH